MKKSYKIFLIFSLFLIIVFMGLWASFDTTIVVGKSMEPTIASKSFVLKNTLVGKYIKPKVGDIIFYKNKQNSFIGRITKESYEKYFIEGDNKNNSYDSRNFGYIDIKDIEGRYVFTIFKNL